MPDGNSQDKGTDDKRALPTDADGNLREGVLEQLAQKAAEQAEAKMQKRIDEVLAHNRSLQSKADKEIAQVRAEERQKSLEAQEAMRAEIVESLRGSIGDDPDAEQALQRMDLTMQQRSMDQRKKDAEQAAADAAGYQQRVAFANQTLVSAGLEEGEVNHEDYDTAEEFIAAVTKHAVAKQKTTTQQEIQRMFEEEKKKMKEEAVGEVRRQYGLDATAAPTPTLSPGEPIEELKALQRAYGSGEISLKEYEKRRKEFLP